MKKLQNKVKIEIYGINSIRFINILKANGFKLFNLSSKDQKITAIMFSNDIFKIKKYIHLTHVRIRVVKRYGFIFYLISHKRRYFFVIGIIIFLLTCIYSSKRITKIIITGNNFYSNKEIYEFIVKSDIDYGTKTLNISCEKLEKDLLKQFDMITFVSANIDGGTLKINIIENDTSKIIKKDNTPCNIIATKDGEIVSIITRAGTPAFKPGDMVYKGNVIVYSHVDFTNVLGENYGYDNVHADADILIKTFTEYEDVINRKYEKKEYTGNIIKINGVIIGNYNICLSKEKCNFKYYDIDTEYKTSQYDLKKLPITYYYETYREFIPVNYEYTDDELYNLANENIDKYIEKIKESSIQTIDKSVNIHIYGESVVAKGTLTTIEPAVEYEKYNEEI